MDKTKTVAVVAVVILVVAAIGVFALGQNNDDDEYKSTNADGRLLILGNADENDYIDSDDIAKIKEMIENKTYSEMADANDDGVVDDKDLKIVQDIIDAKKNNVNKEFKDKTKVRVKYIDADKKIRNGTYPVDKVILINSARSLDIAVGVGMTENIVAMSSHNPWEDNFHKGLEKYNGMVGERKMPNLETIVGIDADTIITGPLKTCCKNIDPDAEKYGSKQILRLQTWEGGYIQGGALIYGFFSDHDKEAESFVKFMDDLDKTVQNKLSAVPDRSVKDFILASSQTALAVQKDGVSSALDRTGATNKGNQVVVDPNASYGPAKDYKEQIKKVDPSLIIYAGSFPSQWTHEQIQEKFDKQDWSLAYESTTAYENGNIVMINYGLPFPIITAIGAHILFPEYVDEAFLIDQIGTWIHDYTNAGEDFEVDMMHYLNTNYSR